MKHYVYLAGPIAGQTYDSATDWRDRATNYLNNDSVECLSPLRGKYFLQGAGVLGSQVYDESPLTTAKGINRRDMFDCLRSTCVLVNLSGTSMVSIGTCMEIAWCFQKQIPAVVVMEKNNVHQHVMIQDCSAYIVETLDEGLRLVKLLLNQ